MTEIKNIIIYEGEKYELTFVDSTDFSDLKPITHVHGLCFDQKGRIAIVKIDNDWSLPGGKIEPGENFEQTLIREVDEEADIEIKNIAPLSYQKVVKNQNKTSIIYQLKYAALISKIKKQTIDPDEGIIRKRKFIKPEDFLSYCPWGNTGKAMINKATEWYNSRKQN